MDITLLHRLLAEGESSRLDYKSEQYRFSGANVEDKAELLKDILAMANAWRDTDAYILIGVREISGHKPEVMGISDHLDDADLQEFVNQKTNRPIHFSYATFDADGTSIGVVHVPLQTRPFFLRKRFGPLDPGIVYLRRGSSTDIADADEIHSMGASAVATGGPSLAVQFANITRRDLLGRSISLKRTVLLPVLFFKHKAEPPRYRFDHVVGNLPDIELRNTFRDASVDYTLRGDTWNVEVRFGKVQPRATVWTDDELLIGIVDKREVVLTGQIFGDNFDPIPLELRIASDPTLRPMTLRELQAEHDREGHGSD